MANRRSTRCPRRKEGRFGILTQRFPGGERLPTLIDHMTGLPPVLAQRFALKRRFSYGSPNTLAIYLRRIGDLYEWYYVHGIDLDDLIVSGGSVDLRYVGRALADLDAGLNELMNKSLERLVAGRIEWDPDDFTPAPVRNPRAHNLRLLVWVMFLRWVLKPANWQGGRNLHPAGNARHDWHDTVDALDEFLTDEWRLVGTADRRSGFTPQELGAIEAVLCPERSGRFREEYFTPGVRHRNYIMYLLTRWGGLRIGETLSMHLEDIPKASTGLTYIIVKRRHDDEGEPRLVAPSVKRSDRMVPMPEPALDSLRSFPRKHRGESRWPDLILSSTEDMPLSYARAGDIAKQVRRYASAEFERRYPGQAHTLHKFSWHRLRHTRARELLPNYVDPKNLDRSSHGMQRFLDIFGWARASSAEPYIYDLRQEYGLALADSAVEDDLARLQADEESFPF